ncbi:MAG: glutaredoxin 3 [Alphaproteobacteria bacterium]|nr:glutaredoxin 3 [Alphaproteobacteria bacterium]
MARVVVYSSDFCPFCSRAKALLARKGVAFEEVDVTMDRAKRAEMEARSGRHTVPQIFIGETHVGGCDDLFALESGGKLDPLLSSGAA